MEALLELAERCEQATKPGLALDIAIEAACVQPTGRPKKWLALQYTSSLDAAMTLVPEEWTSGHIAWPGYNNGKLINKAVAELHHEVSSGGGPKERAYAAAPALALCAAALRARAAKCDTHPQGGDAKQGSVHG